MKFSKTILAVAAFVLSVSSAKAVTISEDSIVVNILRDGLTGDSMLIDTHINGGEIVNGTLASWTSNTDLTAAISSFISGATSVEMWVAGKYEIGPDKYALSTTYMNSSQAVNGFVDGNYPAYVSESNIGLYGSNATVGLTENWYAGIPAGDKSHFQNANMNGLVASIPLGADGPYLGTQAGFFIGTNQFVYDNWRLDASGELTYGAASVIPVPAAVWLFGSGLLGLVGIARRRKA